MKRKLLVLDLDGTLLTTEKKILEQTKKKLQETMQKGNIVALASGRPHKGIVKIAEEINLEKYEGYTISYNGARVENYKTKEIIFSQYLEHKYLPDLYKFAEENNLGIMTYSKDTIIANVSDNKYIEYESKLCGMPVKVKRDYTQAINFPINKCIVTADAEIAEEKEKILIKDIGDKLSIYRSEPFFIEIMPQNINKAVAIEKLAQKLNIENKNIICCGDGFNDISMIKYAGIGVAMKNTQKVLKDEADYITEKTNDEGAIEEVIDKFMN